jgi:hypothetical protein
MAAHTDHMLYSACQVGNNCILLVSVMPGRQTAQKKPKGRIPVMTQPTITETNMIDSVLFGMGNRVLGPYLAAINSIRILAKDLEA